MSSKRYEVGPGQRHSSSFGNVSGPEIHLAKALAIAAGYFRAAHIYMLISMPTGTSTIFGAFQAIRRSFCYRTNFALGHKVLRIKKFASEIFAAGMRVFMLRCEISHAFVRRPTVKQRGIKRFRVDRNAVNADFPYQRSAAGFR